MKMPSLRVSACECCIQSDVCLKPNCSTVQPRCRRLYSRPSPFLRSGNCGALRNTPSTIRGSRTWWIRVVLQLFRRMYGLQENMREGTSGGTAPAESWTPCQGCTYIVDSTVEECSGVAFRDSALVRDIIRGLSRWLWVCLCIT